MLYKKILKSSYSLKHLPRLISNFYYSFKMGEKASLPFKLQLENGNICNLRCKMCPINKLKRNKGQLTFKNFKYVFDQINPPYLNLTGIGEPLINKDIFKIIKYAKGKKSFVKIDSNATLIDKEVAKKLIDSKLDILSISIDGTNKKTYEAIRRGANFENVIKNLKNIIKLKKSLMSNLEVHLFMVLQKENIEELPAFIRLGEKLGVDSINGTFVCSLGVNADKNISIKEVNKEKISKILEETNYLIKNSKVDIRMDNLLDYLKNPYKETHNIEAPCFMPWYSPFITWDGYVSPCCICTDKQVVFGNIFEEPFKKIWNNKKAQNFRRQLTKKRITVLTNSTVTEVTKDFLIIGEKKQIKTKNVFWTAGVIPNQIKTIPKLTNQNGYYEVNEFLEVKNEIYAIGDCALNFNPGKEKPNQLTAQLATKQAHHLAKNLSLKFKNKSQIPFVFKPDGFLVSVGSWWAIAELNNMGFRGILAWWLWRTIYLSKIIGIKNKIRVGVEWFLLLFSKRDGSEI